jgi:hypothetical protein
MDAPQLYTVIVKAQTSKPFLKRRKLIIKQYSFLELFS